MATVKEKTHKGGSISYEIRVSLGRDLSGKQVMKYHTWEPSPGMTAKQVEKALEREKVLFEERCRSGQVLDTSTKFAEFAEIWLDSKKDSHSPAYQKRARSLLERINAGIGHLQISKLQPHHLKALYDNLGEAGVKKSNSSVTTRKLAGILKDRGMTRAALSKEAGLSAHTVSAACREKPINADSAGKIAHALGIDFNALFSTDKSKEALSPKTVVHHHRLISSILEAAVKWQVIYDNPARRVDAPKAGNKEAAYLDEKQALEVVEALSAAPLKWQAAVMLLAYSGMRRGEMCGLSWADVDFKNSLVSITKASQYLPEKGIFDKPTKTASSVRVIKLPPDMFHLLDRYRKWQLQERLKIGQQWHDTGKVFTQWDGLPMHPDSITGWVAKFRKAHNLPYFSPHTLRHTSATLLIMQGVPVKAVSARLGHANQNTTNMVYSHAIKTVDAMASEVIGDILKPIKNAAINRAG